MHSQQHSLSTYLSICLVCSVQYHTIFILRSQWKSTLPRTFSIATSPSNPTHLAVHFPSTCQTTSQIHHPQTIHKIISHNLFLIPIPSSRLAPNSIVPHPRHHPW